MVGLERSLQIIQPWGGWVRLEGSLKIIKPEDGLGWEGPYRSQSLGVVGLGGSLQITDMGWLG